MALAPELQRLRPSRPLTPRELAICQALASGHPIPRIARQLGCSINTVRTHLRAGAGKLPPGLPPRLRLALWAHGVQDLTARCDDAGGASSP